MTKKKPVKKLEIDLTAADLEQGAHWLADKATTEFENAKPPPYQAIIKPWPLPQPVPNPPPPEVQPDGRA